MLRHVPLCCPVCVCVCVCLHRAIRELHLQTCDELGVEPAVKAEIVTLLDNLQQLLIGICIMQVGLGAARV